MPVKVDGRLLTDDEVLGTLFVLIGVAFKLSVVPFHFWCPDVFEGASAEVAGFLSVASKGAALSTSRRGAASSTDAIATVRCGAQSLTDPEKARPPT